MALTLFAKKSNRRGKEVKPQKQNRYHHLADYQAAEKIAFDQDPLRRILQQRRFGYIVRKKHDWRDNPQIESIFQSAANRIDDDFALVPEGFVSLYQTANDFPGCQEMDMETEAFLIARYCITNRDYQLFVDGGGYEDLSLWPQDIWPHMIDFQDLTGETGPRYWRNGRHDQRLADHPVVGVCYYEAAAYAQWAGYRLPTEAEWQMAASWRIRSSSNVLRRYHWGDALDKNKCNIWISGVGHTVPVDQYADGAAPNGVMQLIGNVWEWTVSDFEITDDEGRPIIGDMLMKCIRGGAYDTYFPAQATSTFRTGMASLIRTHNVGFRCVLDLSTQLNERSAS